MAAHPYYPQELSVPGFVPGAWSMAAILAVFGVAVSVVLTASWSVSSRWKHLRYVERLSFCWWIVTGLIHILLEGPFVVRTGLFSMPAEQSDFATEVWKEYAKGDSRYAIRDSTIVGVEGMTAFLEGPGSLLAAYALATQKSYRGTLELMVSLGQLYGCILYFLTEILEGFVHAVPHPLYFWFYFVFMNTVWVVVPFLIILRTWRQLSRAMAVADFRQKQQ